jgi:hypothetical protein
MKLLESSVYFPIRDFASIVSSFGIPPSLILYHFFFSDFGPMEDGMERREEKSPTLWEK